MLLFTKVAILNVVVLAFINYVGTDGMSSFLLQSYNVLFCNRFYLEYNVNELTGGFNAGILGQPFIKKNIIPTLTKYFEGKEKLLAKNDRGPLIFRFQGPIGVGKTMLASRFLNSNFFLNKHFIPGKSASDLSSPEKVNKFKAEVKKIIKDSLKSCKRAVFVFDDVNEITSSIFLDLPPFQLDPKIDFSESVFIFISQGGSENIVTTTQQLLETGVRREDFNLDKFMDILKNLNSETGYFTSLWSGVVNLWSGSDVQQKTNEGVEVYIPFLPLDIEAVKVCIEKEAKDLKLKLTSSMVTNILSQVGCPSGYEKKLCSSGCKLVSSKLPLISAEHDEL